MSNKICLCGHPEIHHASKKMKVGKKEYQPGCMSCTCKDFRSSEGRVFASKDPLKSIQATTTFETNTWSISTALFNHMVIEKNLRYVTFYSWPSDVSGFPVEFPVELIERNADGQRAVFWIDKTLVFVTLGDGYTHHWVAAETEAELEQTRQKLTEIYPVPKRDEDQRIPLSLWVWTEHGARKVRRKIDVPTWTEVEINYPGETQERLQKMIALRPKGGQVILWHGVPGTGKTYALRALAWEWREWCDFHYIVDPEVMFGKQPSYLLEALLDSDEFIPPVGDGSPDRWRLLVLEDTGEMLMPDAKQHVGQSLSRLLNVTDGLIGQGLRIMILITTNEVIGKLHPAVSRPGRAAAKIEFHMFDVAEAERWFKERDSHYQPTGSLTLAEMYAYHENRLSDPAPKMVGFGRG